MIQFTYKLTMDKGHKLMQEPTLPPLSVDEMLKLAKNDPTRFQKISNDAGHLDSDTFRQVLVRSKERGESMKTVQITNANSINRFASEPNPEFEQYYTDLERALIKQINNAKYSTSRARDKYIALVQDTYRQLYEREKHVLIYERVKNGMSLEKAYEEVSDIFSERSRKNLIQSDLPFDIREAESKAMIGIYAKSIGDVDISTDSVGSAEKFNVNIYTKRLDGRKHWHRGKPDPSD